MPTTPAMQNSKALFAHHRLTLFIMLGVLLMLASSILIFRIGDNQYEQALSLFPLAGAVLSLIISPLVWQHEETVRKNQFNNRRHTT